MANRCYFCRKKGTVGKSQKHRRGVAGKRWKKRVAATKRIFKPNLQAFSFVKGGRKMKVQACAKCIKKRKKEDSLP